MRMTKYLYILDIEYIQDQMSEALTNSHLKKSEIIVFYLIFLLLIERN